MVLTCKKTTILFFYFKKRFCEILRYFVLEIEELKISHICKISRNSTIFQQIRVLTAKVYENISYFSCEVEIDESVTLNESGKKAFIGKHL